MRCRYCNTENLPEAVFCKKCGKKIVYDQTPKQNRGTGQHHQTQQQYGSSDNANIYQSPPMRGYDPSKMRENKKQKGGAGKTVGIVVLMLCVLVVAAGAGYFISNKLLNNKNGETVVESLESTDTEAETEQMENTTSAEEATSGTTEAITEAPEEQTTQPSEVMTTEAPIETNALDYTMNKEASVSSCVDASSFAMANAPDSSFEFAYPKYLFNTSSVNEDGSSGYNLAYEENGVEIYSLDVYSVNHTGDAVTNRNSLHNYYKALLSSDSEAYFYPTDSSKGVSSDGLASGVAAGVINSSTGQSKYAVVASDGSKDYVLEFTYIDSNTSSNTDYGDYIAECLYRGCSFSGSSSDIRSYVDYVAAQDEE